VAGCRVLGIIITVFLLVGFASNSAFAQGPIPTPYPNLAQLDGKAIPEWIKNQFEWYVNGEIDEKTLLTSMNWMFDNNIMHLSQESAQHVADLKAENMELKAKLEVDGILGIKTKSEINESKDLIAHELTHTAQQDGDSSNSEPMIQGITLILTPTLNSQNSEEPFKVLLIPHSDSMPESQSEFDAEMSLQFARSYDPITRTLQVGNSSSVSESGEFWFENLKPGRYESTSGSQITPSQIKVIILASVSESDFASKTVDDILAKGGERFNWEDGIALFSQRGLQESTVPELEKIIILCHTEIGKKTERVDAEMKILEQWLNIIKEGQSNELSYDTLRDGKTAEYQKQYNQSDLDFITSKLASIDHQIESLETGIEVFQEKLSSLGDDAQLANIDLQNALQKQQQTLQTISNVSKMQHDTLKSIISNMR